MSKPWITKGIFVSIRKKQKLYVTHYLKGNEIQKKFYKTYANKLTKLKTISKKLYLESEILNSKQDSRKFWSIIQTLTPGKPHSNSPDLIENENGAIVIEPNEIAENFNKHFCSIAKYWRQKIIVLSRMISVIILQIQCILRCTCVRPPLLRFYES